MTRSELKNWLVESILEALARDWHSRFPIGIGRPTIQTMDPGDVLVDRVMEEDSQEAIFIKVSFH